MKCIVTEDFYGNGRLYRAQDVHDLGPEEIARFKANGQIRRLRPIEAPPEQAPATAAPPPQPDLAGLSKIELVNIASTLEIPNPEAMRKTELIEAIRAKQGA